MTSEKGTEVKVGETTVVVPAGWQSLHNHTTRSDGELEPAEFLACAQAEGAGVVAFTDHDALPRAEDVAALREMHGPCAWVLGAEFSSGVEAACSAVHIVGLFLDPADAALQAHCARVHAARLARVARIVRGFAAIGVTVTAEEILAQASADGSVGRPHIVEAVLATARNVGTLKRLARRQAALVGAPKEPRHGRRARREVRDMLGAGAALRRVIYPLCLSDDAAVGGVYHNMDYFLDVRAVGRLVHAAGGLAFLAHYPTCARQIPLDRLERHLRDGDLDGIEMHWQHSLAARPGAAETRQRLQDIVRRTHCLVCGGGDIHTRDALVQYAHNSTAATTSLLQDILASGRVSVDTIARTSSLLPPPQPQVPLSSSGGDDVEEKEEEKEKDTCADADADADQEMEMEVTP